MVPNPLTGAPAPPDWLCRSDDDFVRERFRWVATLDDGQVVYGDNGRPGLPGGLESAWVRLRAYCLAAGRHVAAMRLQFRSHVVDLPPGRAAYYCVREAFAVQGGGETHHAVIAGWSDGGPARLTRWQVPELVPLSHLERPFDPDDPAFIVRTFDPA